MVAFLSNNAGTIFAGLILLGIVAAIIVKMCSDRKKGCCAYGCGGCGSRDSCEKRRRVASESPPN
ncbi:MAG: FeoB-associated Cys-rich membrane protein [Chitinispirillales bacterium]|jgi:hypothetical protein|nr:FeoB-associated Cys-rich membrane protein [Chitinispirillales bacterium]